MAEDTLKYIKKQYGEAVKVGARNIVDEEGFRFLVKAGANFIKSASAGVRYASHDNNGYRKRAGNCCIRAKAQGTVISRDRYLYSDMFRWRH